jgi:hypothetical protein
MSVEYSATLGFGYVVNKEDILDPNDDSPWEVVDEVMARYPLLDHATGGGGWSNTDTTWAIFIGSTMQELNEVDGVIRLARPTIGANAYVQLHNAYVELTGKNVSGELEWLVVGGFY